MKVEVISIGTRLLLNDILDTNAAYLSRYLREAHIPLICKVTIGDDVAMIMDVLQVALRRADVVMMIGGNPTLLADGEVGQAIRQAIQQTDVAHWQHLGREHEKRRGFLLDAGPKTIVCFPTNRREIAYMLTNEVLPYLQTRFPLARQHQTLTLRVVGLAESSLHERLDNLVIDEGCHLSYDSFAGQTDVQLWATAVTTTLAQQKLQQLQQAITKRLGDHIFGSGQDQLETLTYRTLNEQQQTLAIAECNTEHALCQLTIGRETTDVHCVTAVTTCAQLETYLQLPLAEQQTHIPDPATWCKNAAEKLRHKQQTKLALLIVNQKSAGGSLILVALASANGVSVTKRSFGGHPDNINDWACTLALAHLRRWLLTN